MESRLTHFPDADQYLWPILNGYLAYVREYTDDPNWYPGPALTGSWKAGAQKLYEEMRAQKVPESAHDVFIYWACEVMASKELVNKSPGSLVWLVQKFVLVEKNIQRRTCQECGLSLFECECE